MPDAPSSEMPDPVALRSRALDLEAMTAMQMRNIDGLRRMVNMIFDSTQKITERQAALFEACAEQIGGAFESEDSLSDTKAIFERQTEAYRDLFGVLASHANEFADITSSCCSSTTEEANENRTDLPMRERRTEEPPATKTGCCCGLS